MKILILKALKWVQDKRDARFARRLERCLNSQVIVAGITVVGDLFVHGAIEGSRITALEKPTKTNNHAKIRTKKP